MSGTMYFIARYSLPITYKHERNFISESRFAKIDENGRRQRISG